MKEEHSIWTYHNKTTMPGTYEIVVSSYNSSFTSFLFFMDTFVKFPDMKFADVHITVILIATSLQVKAENLPCGKAEYEIMASSKDVRQPPELPEDTCIEHHNRFTSRTSVGLKVDTSSISHPSRTLHLHLEI